MLKRRLRVAVLNYADVRNFGDVLFPLIVARELGARIPNASIQFVTPTGSSWAGMETLRFDTVNFEDYDAVVVGGGELVHRLDDMLKGIYGRFGLACIDRPTDLVFGWADTRARFKAWVSLGVYEPTEEVRADIRQATSQLHFVSARGSRSAERLCQSGASKVAVTPDLGWLFPRLLEGRSNPAHPAGGRPYLTFQATNFVELSTPLSALRRIAKDTGLRIVLLPLTRCWDDATALRALQEASDGEFLLIDDAMSDLDKLAVLGGASMYIGQSMHGLIGSLGQSRPGGICMPEADDKFSELLRDIGLPQYRTSGWNGIEALAQTLLWSPPGLIYQRRAAIEARLDAMFDDLATQIVATAG